MPVRLVIFMVVFVLAKVAEPVIGFGALLRISAATDTVLYPVGWWMEQRQAGIDVERFSGNVRYR